MNTGGVLYTKLMKVYKGILDENGNPIPVLDCFGNIIQKCNDYNDVDYIPPQFNLGLCPTDYPLTTIYNPNLTTTSTTTTTLPIITTAPNCNFTINEVITNCDNDTYLLIQVNTTLTNGIVNVLITNSNNTIARNNVQLVNGIVYFSLPYSSVGINVIQINYLTCTQSIQSNIQCPTTFGASLMPIICDENSEISTTLSPTTTTTTTTVNNCSLNSISISQILPQQLRVNYVGANISNFNWTVLQNGISTGQTGLVTNPVGNTFDINLQTPLCNGLYTVLVTPSNCPNQYKQGNVTITGNICCTISIATVTSLSPTSTQVTFTSNGTGSLDWRIKQGVNDIYSSVVSVVDGTKTLTFTHPAIINGNYTFQIDKGMSCSASKTFSINTTTSQPCNFILNVPLISYNSGSSIYNFAIPITNTQPNYTISVRTSSVLLVSFSGSPNANFSLPRYMSGFDLNGAELEVTVYSESVSCTKVISFTVIPTDT